MKKLFFFSILAPLLIFSCNKIDENSFTVKDNFFEVMPISFKKNVLIESFCGEGQPYNKEEGELLDSICSLYPNQVFGVRMHYNDWLSSAYNTSFAAIWNPNITIPRALINRIPAKYTPNEDELGQVLISPRNWLIQTKLEIATPANFALGLSSSYSSSNILSCRLYFAHKYKTAKTLKIKLLIIENNKLAQSVNTYNQNKTLIKDYPINGNNNITLFTDKTNGDIQYIDLQKIDLQNIDINNINIIALVYDNNILNSIQFKPGATVLWNK